MTTSSIPTLVNFVQQAQLQQLFQSLRNSYHNLDQTYNLPVILNNCYVTCNGVITSIGFKDLAPFGNTSYVDIWFNFNNTSHINYFDIIGPYDAVLNYTDLQGISQTQTVSFGNVTTYKLNANGGSTAAGGPFCPFITQTNYIHPVPNGNRISQNFIETTIDTNGTITFNNQSINRGDPIPTNPPATTVCECIPQTVAPVACEEKYNLYREYIQAHNLPTITIMTADQFCNLSLQYVVDSYIYYMDLLNVESADDPNFLTIAQFGLTDLNYGYNQINQVIQNYFSYIDSFQGEDVRLYWNDYVNTIYMAGPHDCPPAAMPAYSPPVTLVEPCRELMVNVSATYQLDSYNAYISYLRQEFIREYIEQATDYAVENFQMTFQDKEYQYTLYYYDQAGNLIKTVAPQGVVTLAPNNNTAINNHRNNPPLIENSTLTPQHGFNTEYKYNTLNQLVWQQTPDGGLTRFAYDALGRIIASQNDKQRIVDKELEKERYSYTIYDYLGRIIEAGEILVKPGYYIISEEGRLIYGGTAVNDFSQAPDSVKREVTITRYSEDPLVESGPDVFASSLFTTNSSPDYNPAHSNRNRVTGIFYYNQFDTPLKFDNAIFYNYDVHGNVKEMVTYIMALRNLSCNRADIITESDQLNDCEKYIKRVVYNYDLISGNVNTVTFQPNKVDQFIHKYNYDADNRIVDVLTSPDGVIWENDADYHYYPHGPLARTELGDKKVQGQDYSYTLQGWIKAVNGENIMSSDNDMGHDGQMGSITKTKDSYGYSLNYFNNELDSDYKAIEGDNGDASYAPLMFSRDNAIPGNSRDLYNGNIKQMTTAVRMSQEDVLPVQKNNYAYDQLNRISSLTSSAIVPTKKGYNSFEKSYSSNYTYDRNGNIKRLYRSAPNQNGNIVTMDDLKYLYQSGNNKLNIIEDSSSPANANTFDNDLESQTNQLAELGFPYNPANLQTSNYIYDEIGQLIEDKTEHLKITWRVDGKVKRVTKSNEQSLTFIDFEYDGLGNRISKSIYYNFSDRITTTYYSRDAQGNVLGVYELKQSRGVFNLFLKEHDIYGSSRVGLEEKNILVYTNKPIKPGPRDIGDDRVSGMMGKEDTASENCEVQVPPVVSENSLARAMTCSGLPVIRNYSLNFGLNKFAVWDIPSTMIATEPNPTNISLNTNIAINNNASIPVSATIYSDLSKLIFKNTVPATPINVSTFSPFSCFTRVQNGDNSTSIQRPTGCGSISFAPSNTVFALNQSGSVEYDIIGDVNQYNGVTIGFVANGVYYGIRTVIVGNNLNFHRVNGTVGSVPVVSIPLSNFSASYQPTVRIRKAYLGVEYTIPENFANVNVLVNSTTINRFNTTAATLRVDFSNQNTGIPNLRVVPEDIYDVTTEVVLSVRKSGANLYKPKVRVNKYSKIRNVIPSSSSIDANNTVYNSYEVASNTNVSSNFALDFSTNFFSTVGVLKINGIQNQAITPGLTWNSTNPTFSSVNIPTGSNRIGNFATAYDFEMCYFNYNFNNLVTDNYNFDDNAAPFSPTGSVTSNATMGLSGAIRRFGPCLLDQDQDGLYDIYEVVFDSPTSTTYTEIDTDSDGCPNHLDNDDDGDSIFTIYEGANLDNDNNPTTGYVLNTDVSSATNPDGIPNYLDSDDDGDGLYTIAEGPTSNGGALSTDTDGDGMSNYLDNDDDNDTLYTFYESADPDGDHYPYGALNTDSYPTLNPNNSVVDTVPNYLDVDDDGDGILTQYENPDPNGDGNPNDSINTDATNSTGNQYVAIDSIPNYLDIDDDGDGYQTWEIIEGGPGYVNSYNLGSGYTLDTDGNGIPNYLDYNTTQLQPDGKFSFANYLSLIGDKRYELNNHLGNVLVVINDKKIPYKPEGTYTEFFNADVLAYNDYYPFGSLVPNRHGGTDNYRYGFNGMEKDDELKGEGNSYDYGARMLDTRVGRWFARDPKEAKYPSFSTYNYALNNPIIYYDFDGKDIVYFDRNGNETARIVDKKINKAFVLRSSEDNLHFFFPYQEAKMPNQIFNVGKVEKGRDYNKYDYQIAASTHLLNQKINKEYNPFTNEGLPEKQPGTGQPDSTVPSLDPNVVKSIVLKETGYGYIKGGWKNGDQDVMQANVGSDPNAVGTDWGNGEKGKLTDLKEDVIPTPSQSIHNGILWLYYKGVEVSNVQRKYDANTKKSLIIGGDVNWVGGKDWMDAAKDYNGGGDVNYMDILTNIFNALKLNSTKDYVNEKKNEKK